MAVMGPSGSGKTTLLNALSGRVRCSSGTVLLGGRPQQRSTRHLVGYSTQHDFFHGHLTLRTVLQTTSELRLPSTLSAAQRQARVDIIVEDLGLHDCLDTVINCLSGGERKRVSIACELLADPPLLLLDEPTSGLDAHNALQLVLQLKRLAEQQRRAVVLSLHQPSSRVFQHLHTVLLLCNGRPAYLGSSCDAAAYLSDLGLHIDPLHNPADYLLEVANTHAHLLVDSYQKLRRLSQSCDCRRRDRKGATPQRSTVLATDDEANDSGDSGSGGGDTCGDQHEHSDVSETGEDPHSDFITRKYRGSTGGESEKCPQNICADGALMLPLNNNSSSNSGLFLPNIAIAVCVSNSTLSNGSCSGPAHVDLSTVLQRPRAGVEVVAQERIPECAASEPLRLQHCHQRQELLHLRRHPIRPKRDDSDSGRVSCSSEHSEVCYDTPSLPPVHLRVHEGLDQRWPASYWTQCKVLTARSWAVHLPLITSRTNWLQTLLLALIAGLMWFRAARTEAGVSDLEGWMFFSVNYWMQHSHFQALSTFPSERDVIEKERASGWYRISAYYFAKTVSEMTLTLALPILYFFISYPMMGGGSNPVAMVLLLLMLLLNALVAQSVGQLVSVSVSSVQQSMGVSAVITLFQQLFGGYLAAHVPPWMEWARYLSVVQYAFRNMCIIEFSMGPPISCASSLSRYPSCASGNSTTVPVEEILAERGGVGGWLWFNTTALLLYLAVGRVAAYLVLRYRFRPAY